MRHAFVLLLLVLLTCCASQRPLAVDREIQPLSEGEIWGEFRADRATTVLANHGVEPGPLTLVRLDGSSVAGRHLRIEHALVVFGGSEDPGSWTLKEKTLVLVRPTTELEAFRCALDESDHTSVRLRSDREGGLYTEIRCR